MEKELLEFMQGERNAVRGDFILSRERTATSEYCYVSAPQDSEEFKPILKGWAKKVKPKREPIATTKKVPIADTPEKTRHTTGGKRPYVMLMQDNDTIIGKLSIGASGVLMKLICGGYIEWGTGRVMDRRSKKPMTAKMISEKLGLKVADGKILLAELTTSKALRYDKKKRAYFIDRRLAKKGGGQSEDKV